MSTSKGLTALKMQIKAFLSRNEAIILNYHSILPPKTPLLPIAHHLDGDVFHEHMQYLSDKGYNCVSIKQLTEYVIQKNLPSKTVAITFDDGFYNNFSVAYPILKRYYIPATVFITTKFISSQSLAWPERLALLLSQAEQPKLKINGEEFAIRSQKEKAAFYKYAARFFSGIGANDIEKIVANLLEQTGQNISDLYSGELYRSLRFLTWDEITEMAASDLISIGSHTINHRRLIYLSAIDARMEIIDSRQIIEFHVGECSTFSYPHGGRGKDFNESHAEMAREAGYTAIFTAEAGSITKCSDLLNLPRVSISNNRNIDSFACLLQCGVSFKQNISVFNVLKGIVTGSIGQDTNQ